jgi:hypothetical protein
MIRKKAERLQALFEKGYAIDYMDEHRGKWTRCCGWKPIQAYEHSEPIRIAKEEQESEVIISKDASRKYYIEEKE